MKNFSDLVFGLVNEVNVATLFFVNGYGIRVTEHDATRWGIEVLKGNAQSFGVDNSTEITKGYLGFLDQVGVENVMGRIQAFAAV